MLVILGVTLYLVAGFIFAILFLVFWVHKIDDAAANTPLSFKLVIFPGCIVLWPSLLGKVLKRKEK